MVKHYKENEAPLCKTKAKKIETTDLKTEVTCKKCLRKLFPPKPKEKAKPKVLHFQDVDGKIVCETTKEGIETTDLKTEVTCKKCLRKIKALSRKKINTIKFIEDRKWGHCLKIRNVFLKLGDNIDSKIGTMILVNDAGLLSTSMKMYGNVLELLTIKEANYLRNWFVNCSMDNGGIVLVSDVKKAFQEKTEE